MIIPEFQHLIWLPMIIIGNTATYILSHTTIDHARSISMHVADTRRSYWIFAIASTISAIPFALFMTYWFVPVLQLPVWFLVLFGLALLGQLAAAWIPHVDGWKGDVHQFCAYGMAILLLPILGLLLAASQVSVIAKAGITILLGWMVVSLLRYHFDAKVKARFLVHQSVYLACFNTGLVLATYL